ncbi:MAG: ASPIC/UnbV domain-containing protein, partial [Planctomycetota bacterium]
NGDGTFADDAAVMGIACNAHGRSEAGMGVLAADLDNDTDLDLFMTHLDNETNTLYWNLGADDGFIDASSASGLGHTSLAYTGFGTAAFDAELDGDLDLVVVNGRVTRGPLRGAAAARPVWGLYAEPNLFYLNQGSGQFEQLVEPVADLCAPLEITRGLAAGDIDDDGDIDLLIANIHDRARLYRNEAPRRGHWLIVRAVDPRLGREAIGAQVTVTAGTRRWTRMIHRGFSYLSSSDPRAHFGLGEATAVDQIEVVWPDGLRERFAVDGVDRGIELVRGRGIRRES